MKTKILYATLLVGLILLSLILILVAPYHIYTLTISEGINTKFLVMPKSTANLYDPKIVDLEKEFNQTVDEYFYKEMHFSHFSLMLPVNHPSISSIPIIKIEKNSARLGISYIDGNSNEIFSFIVEHPIKMETSFNEQKLFLLPIFKNYILKKNSNDLWFDLFIKKLSLPSSTGKSFFSSLVELQEVKYKDLVYNLFILLNRNILFPNNFEKFGFDLSNHIGVIELKGNDSKFKEETIYLLDKNIVYPVSIKTKLNNKFAENLRKRLIKKIKYKASSSDSSIPIYAEYKNISYNKKLEEQGMTYLYSAWSHDISNKEFVRVIILYLERGASNLKYLKPFYEYAFKKFGSSLSSDGELRLETEEEKLKRKMAEELEKEITVEAQNTNKTIEDVPANKDEKIIYNLKKSKEKNVNSDSDRKSLSIE